MPETFHSSEQVKVFILYLLEKIGYPLEYNDLASIVLRDGYVDYFDFVKNFHELLEKGHIAPVETGGDEDGNNDGEERSASLTAAADSPAEGAENVRSAAPCADTSAGHAVETDSVSGSGSPDEEDSDGDVKVYETESDRGGDDEEENRNDGGQSAYVVTSTGRMIARGLSDDLLLAAVREKSYVSAMRHLSLEKRGAVWNHSLEKDGEGYIFHCSIRDRDGVAFHLDLRADSYPQAERMRMNFEDKPDVVYRGIVAMVTGNVNYLFEK